MKIAVVHELHRGGARRAVNEIAHELMKSHDVDLYVIDTKENKDEKEFFTNTFFYQFTPKIWKGGSWKVRLYKDTIELYRLYQLHNKIAQEIDKKGYDVIFVHPSQFTQTPFVMRFLKTRKVYYCEEPLRIAYESIFAIHQNLSLHKKVYEMVNRWIRKLIDKQNISKADVVIANSKYTQKNIEGAYGLKSIVGYLGVNERVFYPREQDKDIDVLFIGSKDEIDGYKVLQNAINLIKKKPIVKTHITGINWITDEQEFSQLYSRSKIVVCLSSNEPFGLIPLEAMASGTPVIAVDEGGYRETIIHGKTGYLIKRDPKHLAEKISFLLLHQKVRLDMQKNARSHILKNWIWQHQVKSLEQILFNKRDNL